MFSSQNLSLSAKNISFRNLFLSINWRHAPPPESVASQQPHVNTTVSHPVRSPVRTIVQLVSYLFINDVHCEYPLVCTLFNVGIMAHESHMVCALRTHGAAPAHNGSLHTSVGAQCPKWQPLFVRGPMDDSLGHSQWPPLGEQRTDHGCMGCLMNSPVGPP